MPAVAIGESVGGVADGTMKSVVGETAAFGTVPSSADDVSVPVGTLVGGACTVVGALTSSVDAVAGVMMTSALGETDGWERSSLSSANRAAADVVALAVGEVNCSETLG